MDDLEKVLNQYRDRFGENFPVMLFRGTPEGELIQMIQKCLDEGELFAEPDLDDEADY